MPRYLDPLRDKQQDPVVCTCSICEMEIFDPDEGDVCRTCRKKISRWDKKTAQSILEDMDSELQKYLSDDLRDTIWNAIAPRYLADET